MSKMKELGKIWVLWNARKITGNEAMYRIHKLFPRVTIREWRKYIEEKEERPEK
jgi:hypothetical protein